MHVTNIVLSPQQQDFFSAYHAGSPADGNGCGIDYLFNLLSYMQMPWARRVIIHSEVNG
jgi:hypothetical protein